MIKMFMKILNFLPNPRASLDFMRLKVSFLYVRSIKTFRFLFMSLLGMGVCLIFLFISLILFHASLFLYTDWSQQTKLLVGLFSAAFYFSVALYVFSKVFSQNRWMEIFHAEDILQYLNKDQIEKEAPASEDHQKKREFHSAHK